MDNRNTLSAWIKANYGSQRKFAKAIGVTEGFISHIVKGRSNITGDLLSKIKVLHPDFNEKKYIREYSLPPDVPDQFRENGTMEINKDQLMKAANLISAAFGNIAQHKEEIQHLNALIAQKDELIKALKGQIAFLETLIKDK